MKPSGKRKRLGRRSVGRNPQRSVSILLLEACSEAFRDQREGWALGIDGDQNFKSVWIELEHTVPSEKRTQRLELNRQSKAVDIMGPATDGRRSDGVLQGSN